MAVRVKARPDFNKTIARAGVTRAEIAAASKVSSRTIDSLANPAGYGRQGFTRDLTAWRIAKGFAQIMQQTEEEAYTQLFVEVEDEQLTEASNEAH